MKTNVKLRRDFDRPNTLRFGSVWFISVHFGHLRSQNHYVSLWFNMASVDIINFEYKLRLGHFKVSSGNG